MSLPPDMPSDMPPPVPGLPVAVEAVDAGEAAWPSWQAPRPPGMVQALGVVSIVLACLAFLANLGTLFWGVGALTMIGVANSGGFAAMVPPPAPTVIVNPMAVDPTDGLTPAQQEAVVAGLAQARPLAPPRAEAVRRLLRQSGQKLFSFPPARLTPDRVRQSVNSSGQLYSDDGSGADFYVMAVGRLEVNDRQAVFAFNDRSEPTVRSDDTTAGNALSPSQIASVSEALVRQASLTPAQQANLKTAGFADPAQTAFEAADAAHVIAAQLRFAAMQPDGDLYLTTAAGNFLLKPSGEVVPFASAPLPAPAAPTVQQSTFWPLMLMIESGVSFLVAILLLVAGICTVRSLRLGRTLHWVYVVIRVPMAVMGAVATTMTVHAMNGAGRTLAAAPPTTSTPVGWMIGSGAVMLLYPIAIVCVLLTPNVRAFFKSPVDSAM